MLRVSLFAASALVLGMCGSASAGTVSGSPFTVQVTVTAGCTISSGPSGTIDFGSVVYTATPPSDIGSTVDVACTNTSPYVIRFTSSNPVASNTNRTMVNGAENVGYQILDSSTLSPIGNTNATGIGATGNGLVQSTPILFHINNWSPVTPAVYTDSVTLQVDF